jgi:hypothetical protein
MIGGNIMTEATSDTQYGKYISSNSIREISLKPSAPKQAMVISSESWTGVGDINCNFAFLCVSEPNVMPDLPHTHEYDEFLYFLAGDPTNMKDLGAEIEIAFGEEWEKHIVTTSAVVYIPKGLQHCPIVVKKVDRPFYFGHFMPTPKYSKV